MPPAAMLNEAYPVPEMAISDNASLDIFIVVNPCKR